MVAIDHQVMEKEQEFEWKESQSIETSVDLLSAAQKQLRFLAVVDKNRWLYDGPGLDKAIYRYNAYWLPLVAKHSESPLFDGPLVVPLDCEWVWHCHRLNPVRYKQDCEEFYGRILDNENVVSAVDESSRKETEEIWKKLYPDEPYELDSTRAHQKNKYENRVGEEKWTKYDLVSAVKRQSPFFYQVSRSYMKYKSYLEGAVARYKGFLHLIKRNKERSIKSFSVPTYDIDLIWHTHQLHPVCYCDDLMRIMGKILEHDDTDSDRSKGQKLDVGFSGTTKSYEAMYGRKYWRAGAMYRGNGPSPVRTTPYTEIITEDMPIGEDEQLLTLPKVEVVEVMLEFVGVRNLPEKHKGNLYVSFSKTQPDSIFNVKRSLTIFSESGEKQVAYFQCQSTGNLVFELMSPSSLPLANSTKTLGTASISLEDVLSPNTNLTMEKWLALEPSSNTDESKQLGLRVAISVTTPTQSPYVLNMIRSRPFSKSSCLFPLPVRSQSTKSWTRVVDDAGNSILSLRMRDSKKSKNKIECRRSVVGITESGETRIFAEYLDSKWSLIKSPWATVIPYTDDEDYDGQLLELTGPHSVRIYPGARLDYEKKRCEKHQAEHKLESHLITAVAFSTDHPYGKAVALLNLKSGTIEVKEEWFLLPAILLTFILGYLSKKNGYSSLFPGNKTPKQNELPSKEVSGIASLTNEDKPENEVQKESEAHVENTKENYAMSVKKGSANGGGCGGGCGSGCGNSLRAVESGGCGGCGGGCGHMAKSGGCGGGCGSGGGCGDMEKSGGCSGGCGGSGGCGNNMAKCGGCGGGGGCGGSGGCGNNMAKCGGCGGGSRCGGGGGCGGGCGGKLGHDGGTNSTTDVTGTEIVVA